ncbi:nuclear transport factor 2 family protein [Acidicapsa ligni]|uniref:nuclear transport factor 2 family protein n=1 Tax=Acidicapsa ligni TaxID=542300 RepID=UPI0021DF9F59|nr:nuclear transport factor 2 family protein [Acidicapsa ligni]
MKHFLYVAPVLLALGASSVFAQTSVPEVSANQPGQSLAASAESPEIRELQQVEDKWSTALNQRDQYGLELVLSPLFVDISAYGDITSRNQQVVAVINQEDKTATTDLHVITVRVLGDIAVANGTYSYKHKTVNGAVEDRGVFTHVFQRQHGNWVCLNAQRTLIRQEVPNARTKAPKTKSQAELPFHIPLFSKGDKSPQTNP